MNEKQSSLEDILASIRRVIAEDSGLDSSSGREPVTAVESTDDAQSDDVLELSRMIAGDGSTVDLTSDSAISRPDESIAPERESEPAKEPRVPAVQMTSKPVADASAESLSLLLAALRALPKSSSEKRTTGRGQTVDEFVTEMISPKIDAWADQDLPAMMERLLDVKIGRMLAVWFDDNLPSLVERVVRAEIGNLVRRAEQNRKL